MKAKKFKFWYLLLGVLLIFSWNGTIYAASVGDPPPDKINATPWFPDVNPIGKTTYTGTLYVIVEDSGRSFIPVDIGDPATGDYRDYVVSVQFILELKPKKGAPLYFSGIGKTCEFIDYPLGGFFPECPSPQDQYYDLFYLAGDYSRRFGAALSSFLKEVVYPQLCSDNDCGYLSEANPIEGSGNLVDVANPNNDPDGQYADEPPPPPWYWVQPVTIVTP